MDNNLSLKMNFTSPFTERFGRRIQNKKQPTLTSRLLRLTNYSSVWFVGLPSAHHLTSFRAVPAETSLPKRPASSPCGYLLLLPSQLPWSSYTEHEP